MTMPRKRTNRRKTRQPAKRQLRLPKLNIDWRRIANVCMVLAVGFGAWEGTGWLMQRPVDAIRIAGPFERVTAVQVEAAISPFIRQGFIAADLDEVRDAVISLPWVQDAGIRRSWPSTLSITVVEEQAAARWGEQGLLNIYGELFVEEATHIPAELPLLSGPAGTELQVAKRFFELDKQLEQRGLDAVALEVDERGSWRLEMSNGMQVRFGAVAVGERVERFFMALDTVLAPVANRVEYVDMRYTNGFSIGWKSVGRVKLAAEGETDPHA
jgi:cell division protein FtsQ